MKYRLGAGCNMFSVWDFLTHTVVEIVAEQFTGRDADRRKHRETGREKDGQTDYSVELASHLLLPELQNSNGRVRVVPDID